jgi:hypothetical protein
MKQRRKGGLATAPIKGRQTPKFKKRRGIYVIRGEKRAWGKQGYFAFFSYKSYFKCQKIPLLRGPDGTATRVVDILN